MGDAVRSAVTALRIIICMTTQIQQFTRPTSISHPTGSSPTVRCLVKEWANISTQPITLRRVNGWGLPGTRVRNLDEVLIRAGFGLSATDSVGDQYLLQLVIRAADDELASRIVLQRLLPPLISIARRRGKINRGGFDEAMVETVAQAWMLIRTYPIKKRPAKIASNLVRDSEYFAFVRDTRIKHLAVAWGDDAMSKVTNPEVRLNPEEELGNLLQEAAKWNIHPRSLRVLHQLADGQSLSQIATDSGVAIRTVHSWRKAALSELREQMRCAG
ncbi:MAG: sigma-70 family RNA polymerase sigma factor [Actinobacteria bacterium]|nr:MAG: sigma-70 family RNA polymerase sigma factor [Actinomycetota bacterium]